MRTIFIEAKYKGTVRLDRRSISRLPKRVGLVSTIQFIDSLPEIQKQFKGAGKAIIGGQILGCDFRQAMSIRDHVDCFLYIGSGAFHPLGLAYETKKPVFVYHPFDNKLVKISEDELLRWQRRRKGAYLKFMASKVIGLIVSMKPGQHTPIAKLRRLEKKYPDKQFYYFIGDTIDLSELQNFPFIESWVNTACPRLSEDMAGFADISQL